MKFNFTLLLLFSIPLLAMEPAPKLKSLTPSLISKLILASDYEVFTGCYTPDSKYLALGGMTYDPAKIVVWSTTDYTIPRLKLPCVWPVLNVTANPNNKELATSAYGQLSLWNIETSAHTDLTADPHAQQVQSLDYNSDGTLLLASYQNGICKIWNLASKTCTATLQGSNRAAWSAKWNPSNTQVATTSSDMAVRFFDTRTNTVTNTLGLQIPLGDVAYNSTGTQLAIAAAYQTLLCDPTTAQIIAKYTLKGKQFPIDEAIAAKLTSGIPLMATPLQFVPGNDDVLIAGMDYGDVTIYDLQNDENSISFKGVPDMEPGVSSQIPALAISPNAKQFVACSLDSETHVWDLEQYLENRKAKLQPVTAQAAARSCRLQ